jgi:hypothetical protein
MFRRPFSEIEAKLNQLQDSVDLILKALPKPPGTAVSITSKFEQRKTSMPLTAPLNAVPYRDFVIGTDANGIKGAQLGPGQTIAVVSADTTVVSFTPDPTPLPDNEGVASIWSGMVNFVAVGGPVNVTYTVSNSDGSVAETDTDTVTVTAAVPGVATVIGDLFEEPVANANFKAAVKK